jgi:peptide/nickel transport system permease protein
VRLALRRPSFLDGDAAHALHQSPVVMGAALVAALYLLGALLAPAIAPHAVFDAKTLQLLDASLPPAWQADGRAAFLLGTDDQGRDVLSAILYGSRVSVLIGLASIGLAMALGVSLGLLSGYAGGALDALIMRVADAQLSFPAVLTTLLLDGLARGFMPRSLHEEMALPVVVVAIALAYWVPFARTVRGSTLVERRKEYVQAARVMGRRPAAIMVRHVLPNVLGPALVIATISFAGAILTEATLSFLGVGVPPTRPSLGTLIRNGNNFLLSGEWWMAVFPGAALVVLVLTVNLLGDGLRDALDPKSRARGAR